MWVAHAGADITQPKYQACFQEYQHYNVCELLKLMPSAGGPAAARPAAELQADAAPAQPTEQTGRVPATVFRPLAPTGAELAADLARYQEKPAAFDWSMKQLRKSGSFIVHTVQFPSPYVSPVECNNTVHCEYFLAAGPEPKPAVIVLHILDGSFIVARVICQRLAAEGTNALLLKMPYYGPRRPTDKAQIPNMADDPEILVEGVTQAARDVRRAATWLSTRPEVDANRIGLCGVSLGGFVTATTAGVDGGFPRVAVVLAGGDLASMVTGNAKEIRKLREFIEEGNWTMPRLKELLRPIEPLTYASRLKTSDVLMLAGDRDEVVPPACAKALAEASEAQIVWYPASHYSMVAFLPAALQELTEHFSAANWP
jgi:dienelactone hydrolase